MYNTPHTQICTDTDAVRNRYQTIKMRNSPSLPFSITCFIVGVPTIRSLAYLSDRLEFILRLLSSICYCAQANLVGKHWEVQDTTEGPSSLTWNPHRAHLVQKPKPIDIDTIAVAGVLGFSFNLLSTAATPATTADHHYHTQRAFPSHPLIVPHGEEKGRPASRTLVS